MFPQQAVGKLRSMRDDPKLQPDAVSYNCVIGAAHRAGQSTVALKVGPHIGMFFMAPTVPVHRQRLRKT